MYKHVKLKVIDPFLTEALTLKRLLSLTSVQKYNKPGQKQKA